MSGRASTSLPSELPPVTTNLLSLSKAEDPGFRCKTMVESKPILIADDREILRSLVLRQLERLGFSAQTVCNGQEAVDALASQEYGLVLMDCSMPEIDGY